MKVVCHVDWPERCIYDKASIEVNVKRFFAQLPTTAYVAVEETYYVGHREESPGKAEVKESLKASTNIHGRRP